jgi:hypothetical protein
MSNAELLTKEEDAQALAQGWSLCWVYDLTTTKWAAQVWAMPSSEQAGLFVVNRARMGDALCIKALRLIQASHQGTT